MNSIQPGSMALFYQSGTLITGLVTGNDGAQLRLMDSNGRIHMLPSGRLCLTGASLYDLSDPLISLRGFIEQVQDRGDIFASALKILADEQSRDLPAIVSELGNIPDEALFALYIGLNRAKHLISHKKGFYRLLSKEEQRLAALSEQQRLQRQAYLDRVKAYIANPNVINDIQSVDSFRQLLVKEIRSIQAEQLPQDLATLIREQKPEMAFESALVRLRVGLGDLEEETDPVLAASGLPVCHPQNLCGRIAVENPTPSRTDLEVICVDDAETRDYDDAISIVRLAEGWQVGVHISDVASGIEAQSELFEAALERVSSIYLPSQTVNMLPDPLAEDEFSLKAGTPRAVVSLYCEVGEDYEIRTWRFRREFIHVSANISYRDLEQKLNQGIFQNLKTLCDKLRLDRTSDHPSSKSSLLFNLLVKSDKIRFKKIDFASPARLMIEELMVLYNRLMAKQASDCGLPFLFRNINSFDEIADEEEEPGSERLVMPVQKGSQAYLSTAPLWHPGIGAKAYLHATSPIRRVVDLINQYQFNAILDGGIPPFSLEALQALMPGIEKRLLLQRDVARRSERYWLLQYLKLECLHSPIDAVFIKPLKRGALFELLPWQKRVVVDCDSTPPPGYEIKLLILDVDPEAQYCRADVIV